MPSIEVHADCTLLSGLYTAEELTHNLIVFNGGSVEHPHLQQLSLQLLDLSLGAINTTWYNTRLGREGREGGRKREGVREGGKKRGREGRVRVSEGE